MRIAKSRRGSMLRNKIQEEMKQAMKQGERIRLEELRYMWSQIINREIDLRRELTDEEVVGVVRQEKKKMEEAIEYWKKAGMAERLAEEETKMAVLLEFVEEMSKDEIGEMVERVIDEGVNDFGEVMKRVMGLAGGRADGKAVAETVRERLGKKLRG